MKPKPPSILKPCILEKRKNLLRNVKVQRRLLKLLMRLEIPLRDEIENMLPNTERNRNYSYEL